ncbi:hypothetical protein C0992_001149 [Termitomyces sp. T32_za158]|nr:hypothetical protein C0992_001149 [Termitomyces sp. T32_za158]
MYVVPSSHSYGSLTGIMDSARDGKRLSPWDLASGLKACYKLSTPLAWFLAVFGFILLRKMRRVDLYEIGEHGRIEHDASLVHKDTPMGQRYAPIEVEDDLVGLFAEDAKTGNEEGEGPKFGDRRILVNATDVARARVRRERQSPKLDSVHAEIARGEVAIILGVWEMQAGKNIGVPVEWMRQWFSEERLPEEWKGPDHEQGLFDVIRRARAIRLAMDAIRERGSEKSKL